MRLINPLISTNHVLAPGPKGPHLKVYPWGVPPRVSSRHPGSPRDVSSPITFSEKVGKTPRALDVAHSTLFSVTGQDGQLAAVVGAVFRADRYAV